MNMLHILSIPYALMKVNPLSWIQKVCQYKGSASEICSQTHLFLLCFSLDDDLTLWDLSPAAKVACVKSRDMHWALVAHRDQRDVNLSSLRMLVVADGSNPCKNSESRHDQLLVSCPTEIRPRPRRQTMRCP